VVFCVIPSYHSELLLFFRVVEEKTRFVAASIAMASPSEDRTVLWCVSRSLYVVIDYVTEFLLAFKRARSAFPSRV